MDKLRAMQLFVRLADLGSFTRVAEYANTSKSMVSKEIGRLEDALGARLLHRATRNVQLTHVGQGDFGKARRHRQLCSEPSTATSRKIKD
jgi:DNA-binding transcriptional LysR family regulator